MTIGEYIKSLRKSNKMTLKDLEKKSGVSNSYLSQIENNKFKPTPDILRRISNGFEINYNILLEKAGYLESANKTEFLSTSILNTYFESIKNFEGKEINQITHVNFMDLYSSEDGDIFSEHPDLATLTRAIMHRYAKIAELGDIASLILRAHGLYEDAINESGYEKEEFAIKMMTQKFSDYDENFIKRINFVFGDDIIDASLKLKRIVNHEWENEIKSLREHYNSEAVTIFLSKNIQTENDEWIEMSPEDVYHNAHKLEKLIFMIDSLTINGNIMTQSDKKKAVKVLKLIFD